VHAAAYNMKNLSFYLSIKFFIVNKLKQAKTGFSNDVHHALLFAVYKVKIEPTLRVGLVIVTELCIQRVIYNMQRQHVKSIIRMKYAESIMNDRISKELKLCMDMTVGLISVVVCSPQLYIDLQ